MRSPFDRFLFFALMPLVIGAAAAILLATPFVLFSGLAMWMLVPVALLIVAYGLFRAATAVALISLWCMLVRRSDPPVRAGRASAFDQARGFMVAGCITAPLELLILGFNLRGHRADITLTIGGAIGALVAFVLSTLLILGFGFRAPGASPAEGYSPGRPAVALAWLLTAAVAGGAFLIGAVVLQTR